MFIELQAVYSAELRKPHMPDDPACCAVSMYADIALRGGHCAETLGFTVITPSYLLKNPQTRWGTGYLLIPEFSWKEVERMVSRLVSSVSGEDWDDAVNSLSRYMGV